MEEHAKEARRNKRRRQILGATLRLLRRHGTGISTAQIASEAKCSKETLYAWFEDREGIFQALVEEQAAAMGEAFERSNRRIEGEFSTKFEAYCITLLDIMTGEAAIAINRLAMADACREHADLGLVVLDDWHARVAAPFKDLFEQGAVENIVTMEDPEEAFEVLIGLLIGDRQRRLLLGEDGRPDSEEMQQMAKLAVARWISIFK